MGGKYLVIITISARGLFASQNLHLKVVLFAFVFPFLVALLVMAVSLKHMVKKELAALFDGLGFFGAAFEWRAFRLIAAVGDVESGALEDDGDGPEDTYGFTATPGTSG